jgi:hypothetical protein
MRVLDAARRKHDDLLLLLHVALLLLACRAGDLASRLRNLVSQ